MNLATTLAERAPLPDGLTLSAIDFFCGQTRKQLAKTSRLEEDSFARDMDAYPIAAHTDAAMPSTMKSPMNSSASSWARSANIPAVFIPAPKRPWPRRRPSRSWTPAITPTSRTAR